VVAGGAGCCMVVLVGWAWVDVEEGETEGLTEEEEVVDRCLQR